jgi:hypothetical protein
MDGDISGICNILRRHEYTDLVGNPERNIPLGRPVHSWNNIEMDLG